MPKSIYFVGFVIVSLALIGGQLLRISFGGIAITALDAVVLGWAVFWLWDLLTKLHRYPIPQFLWWGMAFFGVALISLIGALRFISTPELAVAFSYLIRWGAYTTLVYLGYALAKSSRLIPALGLVFGLVAVLGIGQWLVAPDISFLERFGWDPHQGRLVSTFLDPNFVGGFLVIGLSLALPQLFTKQHQNWRWYWAVIGGLTLVGIYLTFSRSALLALLIAVLIIGTLKYRQVAAVLLVVMVLVYIISPKLQDRVKGALVIDQTARYRIESWSEGLNIMRAEPLLGVGFNTLLYTRDRYGYWPGGHASSGFDSSLLTVGATTGGLGLLAYLGLLVSALLLAWRKWRSSSAPIALSFLAATGALLVHSLFVNSLLYPSVLVVWWIILGLVWAI
ncbi:O-antigen ligase family protein [Patescibacteria group bacterium]|nr:O-antigen ligase family protein [Patescibacteria group bacterium]